eukprot:TRINITY_DN26647_c0_g1_i1.p1 TRINITY_DN26647_c0_g1~~TRINITY_DN26647_c0_g1_i1.p1  ORF type:complete len:280 (+),score=45.68 TRINITY_DN26647_c0_g1_i1:86-841(+)
MIHSLLEHIQPGASDDEDDERPDVEFTFRGAGLSAECQTLVLCGPGAASAFALQALELQPLSWRFESSDDSCARIFPPAPKSPSFFQVAQGAVVVAMLESPVAADFAVEWAQGLLKSLSSDAEVVVLDRILRAEWASSGQRPPEEPYLAGLWTSSWQAAGRETTVPFLPAPNIVEGLLAALLTHCEASRRRCLVALALQDGAHLGEGCIRGFEALMPLLTELKVLSSSSTKLDCRAAVQKVVPPSSMSIYA